MRGFLTVRTRFLLALILPFLGVIGTGWIILSDAQATLTTAEQTANVVDLAPAIDSALAAIREESNASVKFLAGEISEAEFNQATARVDLVTSSLVASVNNMPEGEIPPLVIQYVDSIVNDNPERRAMLRAGVLNHAIEPSMVVLSLAQVSQTLALLPAQLAHEIEDRELAAYLDAYSVATLSLDSLAVEITLAQISEANPGSFQEKMLAVGAAAAVEINMLEAQRAFALLPDDNFVVPVLSEPMIDARSKLMGGDDDSVPLETRAELLQALDDRVEGFATLRDEISSRLGEVSHEQITEVRSSMTRTLVVLGAFFVASVGIALLFARSILTPLNRLKTAATELSERLPEIVANAAAGRTPEKIESVDISHGRRDEIGSLARAFSLVNETAVQVAGEQATLRASLSRMFVSIARRDSVLVNRQLAYLDEYERSEESPTVLSRLFALDHLATQMRRNNESLLIISGADTGTRFRGAVAMTDVIRSSISEIDQFERIHFSTEVNEFDRPMHGHVARHAIHLFAELLENATRYSPPTSAVQITARADGDIVRVLIRDQGIGMSDEELAEANARVRVSDFSDLPDVDRLGLSVVARLRARCNAVVDFTRPAVGEGILVCVSLPMSSFIIKDTQPHAPVTAPSAAAPAAHAPVDATFPAAGSRMAPAAAGSVMPTRQPTSGATMPTRQSTMRSPQHEPLVEVDHIDDDTDREAVQMFLNDMR